VHLDHGEKDPRLGLKMIADLDCKGIIFVLLIKELDFLVQNDVVLNTFNGLCLTF
jgi:hypothetical protein